MIKSEITIQTERKRLSLFHTVLYITYSSIMVSFRWMIISQFTEKKKYLNILCTGALYLFRSIWFHSVWVCYACHFIGNRIFIGKWESVFILFLFLSLSVCTQKDNKTVFHIQLQQNDSKVVHSQYLGWWKQYVSDLIPNWNCVKQFGFSFFFDDLLRWNRTKTIWTVA